MAVPDGKGISFHYHFLTDLGLKNKLPLFVDIVVFKVYLQHRHCFLTSLDKQHIFLLSQAADVSKK